MEVGREEHPDGQQEQRPEHEELVATDPGDDLARGDRAEDEPAKERQEAVARRRRAVTGHGLEPARQEHDEGEEAEGREEHRRDRDEKVRMRNRASGTIGSATRDSIHTKSAANTRPIRMSPPTADHERLWGAHDWRPTGHVAAASVLRQQYLRRRTCTDDRLEVEVQVADLSAYTTRCSGPGRSPDGHQTHPGAG